MTEDSLHEVTPGEVLCGRYQVDQVLGAGGMATVHAGIDLRLDRPVAIKILRVANANDAARKRFEREARLAANITHPNVVSIYDTGEDDDAAFIVMERLPGSTFEDELKKGPVTTQRTIEVGAQVLAALTAAHNAGIVHRDVKPSNVLTCSDNLVKVTDFGIARISDLTSTITNASLLIGTPMYLAPEIFEGQPATIASDLYSVGAMLYQSLTGRKPFDTESVIALISMVRNSALTPLIELRPDVDSDLAWVIEKALSREPDDRFSSAAEMSQRLVMSTPAEMDVTQEIGRVNREIDFPDVTEVFAKPLDLPRSLRHSMRSYWEGRLFGDQIDRLKSFIRPSILALGVVLTALVVVVIIIVIATSGGSTPTTPTTASTASHVVVPNAALPQPLQKSLDDLAKAIQQ